MALLQTGRIDEALNHLDKARSLSKSVDTTLWLSLARIYRHLKRHDRARDLYLDILNEVPDHLLALAGIADASVELDDIEAFLNALERLMIVLDIPVPEAVIESLGECSDLCMQVADRLKRKDEPTAAMRLAETALRLDPSNSRAHLFLADLFAEQGEIARMLARLETALKCGAGSQEVLTRIALARQALGMT